MAMLNEARREGRVADAVEASLRAFTDGPRRSAAQVNPVARARTAAMTARLFARSPAPEAYAYPLDPPAATRLAAICIPTLIIVGGEDQPPIHAIAEHLHVGIANAQSVVLPDAGHHPNLEHPAAFNQILATFLATLPPQ
jgi:pimeloyl-ACP methyl ester carboxylesterase